jgi:carboxymethylenebutenolidase
MPTLDTKVNEGWPAYETALKANNKEYTAWMYENANHGFHNDTTPRYDKALPQSLPGNEPLTFSVRS